MHSRFDRGSLRAASAQQPKGASEVYVAPQQKKKQKGKAKDAGEEEGEAVEETSLQVISDAALKQLDELKVEFGGALRIAVEPERSFVAITGSHIHMRVYARFMALNLLY